MSNPTVEITSSVKVFNSYVDDKDLQILQAKIRAYLEENQIVIGTNGMFQQSVSGDRITITVMATNIKGSES